LRDRPAQICQPLLYFSGVAEIGAHAPPNPRQAARQIELFSELSDNFSIAVRFQERRRKRQPLSTRHDSHHVEQEDEQIVRLSGGGHERFFVDNFEVNESCAVTARIVNYILGSAIAMGPAPAKVVTPKLVGAAKLSRRGDQHGSRQRPAIQVLP
jgi:hypothetical protein